MDKELYIAALQAAKDDVLDIIVKAKSAAEFLSEVQAETEGDFPYTWDLDEISRRANSFVQQVDVDIQAFERMASQGETQAETTTETKKDEVIKSLTELLSA